MPSITDGFQGAANRLPFCSLGPWERWACARKGEAFQLLACGSVRFLLQLGAGQKKRAFQVDKQTQHGQRGRTRQTNRDLEAAAELGPYLPGYQMLTKKARGTQETCSDSDSTLVYQKYKRPQEKCFGIDITWTF